MYILIQTKKEGGCMPHALRLFLKRLLGVCSAYLVALKVEKKQ